MGKSFTVEPDPVAAEIAQRLQASADAAARKRKTTAVTLKIPDHTPYRPDPVDPEAASIARALQNSVEAKRLLRLEEMRNPKPAAAAAQPPRRIRRWQTVQEMRDDPPRQGDTCVGRITEW